MSRQHDKYRLGCSYILEKNLIHIKKNKVQGFSIKWVLRTCTQKTQKSTKTIIASIIKIHHIRSTNNSLRLHYLLVGSQTFI